MKCCDLGYFLFVGYLRFRVIDSCENVICIDIRNIILHILLNITLICLISFDQF